MEGEAKKNDMQSLFAAIEATEDLESQISLINQIGNSYQLEASDVALLIEWLTTLWEESTCSGMPKCRLHKTVLRAATNYLESDIMNCLNQFIVLGTKASIWCKNHLQVTLTSAEESWDEQHRSIFYELILDSLSFSSAAISTLTKYPPFVEKVDMLIIENFIFETLSLTKVLILEFKRINLIASEVLKVGQVVLDAAIKLCRSYYQSIRCNSPGKNVIRRKEVSDADKVEDYVSHVTSITLCTIKKLFEIGTFAASGGGSLVSVLNISWKGVICLLQLDKGVFSDKVNVGEIILTLVSLSVESLRCAAESWSELWMDTIALTEVKRTFLPIKFYLINSVRISSEYPCNAMNMYKEIVRCVVLISSLYILLSKEAHLKAVSEAIAELLEPTSSLLLHTLLNSAEVTFDSKLQMLEWLFPYDMDSCILDLQGGINAASLSASLDTLFDVSCDAMFGAESQLLGKVLLFLNLLKTSSSLSEEIILEFSRKLDDFLAVLTNANLFSSVLGLQIPVFGILGPSTGVVWQPMYAFVLNTLKTFMIAASSSRLAWLEIETFLLQNLFHPHFLCLEIVMQLLYFLICHAENDMVKNFFEKLCLLLRTVASSEPSLSPSDAPRKLARLICELLALATPATVDQVYTTIVSEEKSDLSLLMYAALLMEGFPLGSLTDKLKILATRKIIANFVSFIESNSKELELDSASLPCNSRLLGCPVHVLSAALHSQHIEKSDAVDGKIIFQLMKFTTAVILAFKNAGEGMKDQYAKLLGAVFDLISNARHLYGSVEIGEIVLELQSLFVEPDATLSQCQPSLATFISGLSHIEISEDYGNPLSAAILGLFHLLLRERHWAFAHLAFTAFGYFAAHTSCTQLWKFVPSDAALSFDAATGNEAKYESFMNELKGFLEKEGALSEDSSCKVQLSHLFREGKVLKRLTKTPNTMHRDVSALQPKEIGIHGECTRKKKRKLPDGICEGMELLQNGLKAMKKALSEADSAELKEEFAAHISCLNDVISHLIGLSNTK